MVIERNFFLCALVESTEQSEQLKENLKEEKQTRKRLESRVDHMEEELNDLKLEKEKLERVRSRNLRKYKVCLRPIHNWRKVAPGDRDKLVIKDTFNCCCAGFRRTEEKTCS